MQFLIVVGVVLAVALLLQLGNRLELPEKTPLYVGLAVIIVAVVWWLWVRLL